MERDNLVSMLRKNVKEENLIKHMFAVEAIICVLSKYFNEDTEKWDAAVLKCFKENRFASSVNRNQIASCSELGLSLKEFTNTQ